MRRRPGSRVLLDTGPMVALFNARDRHHERAVEFFEALAAATICFTTWEVVSEAMYMLDYSARDQCRLLGWLHAGHADGLVRISALNPDDLPGLARLIDKYADRPMDLADASLVSLADGENITDVATVDQSDFNIYRTSKGKAFRNVFNSN